MLHGLIIGAAPIALLSPSSFLIIGFAQSPSGLIKCFQWKEGKEFFHTNMANLRKIQRPSTLCIFASKNGIVSLTRLKWPTKYGPQYGSRIVQPERIAFSGKLFIKPQPPTDGDSQGLVGQTLLHGVFATQPANTRTSSTCSGHAERLSPSGVG